MSTRTDHLKVQLTALTCADTFLGRYVCQARYVTGKADPVAAAAPAYFQLYRSAHGSWSFLDVPGLAQSAYDLSPRKCSLRIAPSPEANVS
jgi:hypothetical protein